MQREHAGEQRKATNNSRKCSESMQESSEKQRKASNTSENQQKMRREHAGEQRKAAKTAEKAEELLSYIDDAFLPPIWCQSGANLAPLAAPICEKRETCRKLHLGLLLVYQ